VKSAGATWQLREFQFVVNETVQADLARNDLSLDFALKYLNGVAGEFRTHITIWHEHAPPATLASATCRCRRDEGCMARFPLLPEPAPA
jgi:hypothetical protein